MTSESTNEAQLSLSPAVAWRIVGGEAFLVTPDRAMHRVAAPSGVAILEALQGDGVRRADLLVRLASRFAAPPEALAADVDAFLASLRAAGVLAESRPMTSTSAEGR